jgi:hypothetical protein
MVYEAPVLSTAEYTPPRLPHPCMQTAFQFHPTSARYWLGSRSPLIPVGVGATALILMGGLKVRPIGTHWHALARRLLSSSAAVETPLQQLKPPSYPLTRLAVVR